MCVRVIEMSTPTKREVVKFLLEQIPNTNPFNDIKKCRELVRNRYSLYKEQAFSSFISRLKSVYAMKKSRVGFLKFIEENESYGKLLEEGNKSNNQ